MKGDDIDIDDNRSDIPEEEYTCTRDNISSLVDIDDHIPISLRKNIQEMIF